MKPIISPESRCWLEIDLAALRQNYRIIESMCSDGCMPIAVVKANAYGLGAVHIAQELERCGCRMLSTADLAEAMELRRAGIGMRRLSELTDRVEQLERKARSGPDEE